MEQNQPIINRQTRANTRKRKTEKTPQKKTFANKSTQTEKPPKKRSKRLQCGKSLAYNNPNKRIENKSQTHLDHYNARLKKFNFATKKF